MINNFLLSLLYFELEGVDIYSDWNFFKWQLAEKNLNLKLSPPKLGIESQPLVHEASTLPQDQLGKWD